MNEATPIGLACPLGPPQGLPARQGRNEIVALVQAVNRIAGPAVALQILYQPGPQWVRLDVPQHGQQMVIILDHGAFEPALPDMADTAMCFVEAPSMGHGER